MFLWLVIFDNLRIWGFYISVFNLIEYPKLEIYTECAIKRSKFGALLIIVHLIVFHIASLSYHRKRLLKLFAKLSDDTQFLVSFCHGKIKSIMSSFNSLGNFC